MGELKKINTQDIRIEKNIMSFMDVILQISNVSQVSIEPIPIKKFNFLSLVGLILGIWLSNQGENIKVYGNIFIIVAVIYLIWYGVTNSREGKFLYIYMNSGSIYYVFCKNESFMEDIMNVIEYCINNHYAKEIYVDLNRCILYNSPIISGDNNEVNR